MAHFIVSEKLKHMLRRFCATEIGSTNFRKLCFSVTEIYKQFSTFSLFTFFLSAIKDKTMIMYEIVTQTMYCLLVDGAKRALVLPA